MKIIKITPYENGTRCVSPIEGNSYSPEAYPAGGAVYTE